MADLIDRQAAIQAVHGELDECLVWDESGEQTANEVEDILYRVPSADIDLSDFSDKLWAAAYERGKTEAQQRWIPCSERSPEKDGDYLTTLTDKDGNYVDVTEWQNIIGGRWIAPLDECDYCEIGNVVAWMPLPEPYKDGEQNG